jgi:hypothetical protein
MSNKLLVFYIGIKGLRSEDIPEFTKRVTAKLMPTNFDGEIISIPVAETDTRVEMINPKYITDKELVDKNNKMILELREQLIYQGTLLKKEINEK